MKKKVITIDKKSITIFAIGLLIAFVACYLFWGNISSNGDRADKTRAELQQATEYNRILEERVKRLETGLARGEQAVNISIERIEDSSRRINESQTRVNTIESGLRETEELARQSKSIIETIRERNEQKN